MNTTFYGTLNSSLQNMIPTTKWYLGDNGSTNSNAYNYNVNDWYTYTYSTNTNCGTTTTISTKIGLPYLIDYMYSAPSSTCSRTTMSGSYSNCSSSNWFYLEKNAYNWYTLSSQCRYSTSEYRAYNIYITTSGDTSRVNGSTSYYLYPVFYLNTSIYIKSGNGSNSNPYYINI